MNELSWTTVSDLVAPFARQGVRAAAAPPARAVLRNWRRVVLMRPPPRSGRPIGTGSRLGTHRGELARTGHGARTGPIGIQAHTSSVPPGPAVSGVSGTLGRSYQPVKGAGGGS